MCLDKLIHIREVHKAMLAAMRIRREARKRLQPLTPRHKTKVLQAISGSIRTTENVLYVFSPLFICACNCVRRSYSVALYLLCTIMNTICENLATVLRRPELLPGVVMVERLFLSEQVCFP